MKDIFGNELQVGDTVATMVKDYRELEVAKIIAFTPKQVRVEYMWQGRAKTYLTPSENLVKKVPTN